MVWCGVAWCGVVWREVVGRGVVRIIGNKSNYVLQLLCQLFEFLLSSNEQQATTSQTTTSQTNARRGGAGEATERVRLPATTTPRQAEQGSFATTTTP